MKLEDSILDSVKDKLGVPVESTSFDNEIIELIDTSLSILNQNGIGKHISVTGPETTWNDFRDSSQTGNLYFQSIPLYVRLYVKLTFDPPPPSAVETYKDRMDDILWRLKTFYEMRGDKNEQV